MISEKNILANTLVLLILLSSGTYLSIKFNIIFNIIFIFLAFLTISLKSYYSISNIICLLIFLLAYFFVFFLSDNNPDGFSKIIHLAVKIIIFFQLSSYFKKNDVDILAKFSLIIYYLSIISCVNFILIDVLYVELLPSFEVNGLKTYAYIYGSYGNDIESWASFRRNSGHYYEPGVFAIFLNFAIFYFLAIDYKLVKSLFLTIIVMSTLSTYGIILCCLIWVVFLLDQRRGVSQFFLGIFLAATLPILFINSNILEKINTVSFSLRLSDVTNGINLFMEKPFFGHGLLNDAKFLEINSNYFSISRGSSNAWLSLLYQGGLFVFVPYVLIWYLISKGFPSLSVKIIFICWLFFSLFSQNLLFSNFFIFLIIFLSIRSVN